MSEIAPDRGQIVPSVETDETAVLAQNAFDRAVDARTRADEAYDFALTVASNASNALSAASAANALATAAQNTANSALATQVSTTGGTLTGPLFLPTANPTGASEAAHKGYVDYKVGAGSVDIFNSLNTTKADKTYVDSQDSGLQSQINTHTTNISDLYTKVVPIGAIIMWSGPSTTIPAGWKLCDGLNGTPDLRNKFILGATATGGTLPPGSNGGSSSGTTNSGGSHSHSLSTNPAGDHTHSIYVDAFQLQVQHLPSHNHTMFSELDPGNVQTTGSYATRYGSYGGNSSYSISLMATGPGSGLTGSQGGNVGHAHTGGSYTAGSHSHSGSTDTHAGHTHTFSFTPPYYALCFIMKVS